jgi:ubiquinone/menaquinone biosynthesis C-methylase UbiE
MKPASEPSIETCASRPIGALADEPELARIEAAYSRRKNRFRYTFFERATLFAVQERERKLLAMLADLGLESLEKVRILEVGCGTGFWLREFVRWGAQPENIHGIDLLPERIAEARRLCSVGVKLECGSATRLKFANSEFDLVLQSTMFTSILDRQVKTQIAGEMLRVLRPKGCIIWYDFRVDNPRNSDVRGIKIGEIRMLFPGCCVNLHKLTLAPPLARPVARISSALHSAFSSISPLRTHYLALIRRA